MIESFREVIASTKTEQVRAWCVQAAIERFGETATRRGSITVLAAEIENYVLNGHEADDYDDETLDRVRRALAVEDGGVSFGETASNEIIRKLQNHGILFRTRKVTL